VKEWKPSEGVEMGSMDLFGDWIDEEMLEKLLALNPE
jgi:hypothetical protein